MNLSKVEEEASRWHCLVDSENLGYKTVQIAVQICVLYKATQHDGDSVLVNAENLQQKSRCKSHSSRIEVEHWICYH